MSSLFSNFLNNIFNCEKDKIYQDLAFINKAVNIQSLPLFWGLDLNYSIGFLRLSTQILRISRNFSRLFYRPTKCVSFTISCSFTYFCDTLSLTLKGGLPMKLLWKLGKEAKKYRNLYFVAIFATFALTIVNLTAPKILSSMTAIVSQGVSKEGLDMIQRLALILVLLYLLRVLFRYLSSYLAHKAAWNLVGEMRVRLYDKLQSFHMGFFHDKQTGDLMSRILNDTRDFELLYAHILPEVVTNTVTFVGVLVILLTINPTLALLTCLPIPFILVSGIIFAKKVRPNFRISQRMNGELSAKLQDNLSGIHEIQAFGQEAYEHDQVEEKAFAQVGAMLRALNYSNFFHPSVEFISSIGTVIVVAFGGFLAYQGTLSVSDIVAFLLYLALFYTPISGLAKLLEDMQQSMAGAERVMLILDTPVEIKDSEHARDIPVTKGALEFDHVSFYYDTQGDRNMVLYDISFSCRPGQMVALVGPTGVGKTTLVSLISRFYEPADGTIRLDGTDICDYTLRSLRSHIAPVMQDTFLFNGTIGENIGYANPAASLEDIILAAKAAHIHDNICQMSAGYDTKVGERGLRLSGGQKQRIAIARAILRKSSVIILDEATASVDVETEREIQKAIQELAGQRTIVAIAHRLSTIRNADLILVLENGKIVEQGTHRELLANNGLYSRLHKVQSERMVMDDGAQNGNTNDNFM
jgi:ABC-type multidrug transport system fused ATPase/permease subunit